MAVGENAGIYRAGSSNRVDTLYNHHHHHQSMTTNHLSRSMKAPASTDQSFHPLNNVVKLKQHNIMSSQQNTASQQPLNRMLQGNLTAITQTQQNINGVEMRRNSGVDKDKGVVKSGSEEDFKREMVNLQELLSNLNPMAEAFVPPSSIANQHRLLPPVSGHFGYSATTFLMPNNAGIPLTQKKSGNVDGKRRMYSRTSIAQQEKVIRRTVYVSDIDHQVTEEQLAGLFLHCGQVVDCRICGDPNSVLRFAFIEFTDEDGATKALSMYGTVLGFYPVKVLPSKTAIAPVNPTFLPQSEQEREMCARTIYCTNIDKKVTDAQVRLFFESVCGKVQHLRLLGDRHHSTRIAFVEFVMAESAGAALYCNGSILGNLPLRISPSKTPIRPRPSVR